MMRLVILLSTGFLVAAPAAAAADTEEAQIERARDALKQRLEQARTEGAIQIRGRREEASAGSVEGQPAVLVAPAPAYDRADCLTIEALSEISESLGAEPLAAIEALRTELLEQAPGARSKTELQLAAAYLAIGFFDEAIAIASARSGPGAAGVHSLGRLAEGDFDRARAVAAPFADCGAISALSLDQPRLAESANLTARTIETLKQLPVALRTPIAEAFAVDLMDRNPALAATFDAISRMEKSGLATPERQYLDAVADKSNEAALVRLASTPGPMRGRAIRKLAETVEDRAPEEQASFDDNLAEAARSATGAERTSLNEMLGKRLVREGDLQRGLKALGAAISGSTPTGDKSPTLLHGAVSTALNAKDPQKRLAALATLADDKTIAERALTPLKAREVANELALYGAAQAVDRIAGSTDMDDGETELARAKAHLRSGRMEEAFAIAARRVNDPRFSGILAVSGAALGAKPIINKTIIDAAPTLLAKSLWSAGERMALSSLASGSIKDAELATRIALAALSLGEAPPSHVVDHASIAEGLRLMTQPAPDPANSEFGDIKEFSERIDSEIAWLKERFPP